MESPEFWNDQDAAQAIVGELKSIKALMKPVLDTNSSVEDAVTLWEMAEEMDDEESRLEVDRQINSLNKLLEKLDIATLLSGAYDDRNCYLSIQSGAGGTEADDWADMLMRMYLYYFEAMGWDVSEVDKTHGTEAGIKAVTLYVKGAFSYGYLAVERGTHRLARVSPFNAEGKRQTSFATVDVIPEFPDTGGAEIDEGFLEIDRFARSSGPGGQNVNKVATAVRLTYRGPEVPKEQSPIMIVVSVERKLEQNMKRAKNMLRGKLELIKEEARQAEMDSATGGAVDRGWGTQIRSYVFYDNRVKDHRTGFEVPNPQRVMDGDLHGFIEAELKRRAKRD